MNPLEIQLLAHRYLYYVLQRPVLTDYVYDMLERKIRKRLPETSVVWEVGSERPEDYNEEVRAYAAELLAKPFNQTK